MIRFLAAGTAKGNRAVITNPLRELTVWAGLVKGRSVARGDRTVGTTTFGATNQLIELNAWSKVVSVRIVQAATSGATNLIMLLGNFG